MVLQETYNDITVSFYPQDHKYLDQLGREYISVTQLLKKKFPFDQDKIIAEIIKNPNSKYYKREKKDIIREWLEIAAYGDVMHKTIENFIKDGEEPTPDSMTYAPWKAFNGLALNVKASEKLFFNVQLRIAGTCDLIIDMGDRYEIWDIKTNSTLDDKKLLQYSMQINLYKHFARPVMNKPVHAGKIIWFENFYANREKTDMKLVNIIECSNEVYEILLGRAKEIVSVPK